MKCPSCGADYSVDMLSCPYCGAENKTGIRRKKYREWRKGLLARKERETVKRAMPEAVSHAVTWVMVFSLFLVVLTAFVCSFLIGAYEKGTEEEAKRRQEEHIGFLEQCLEEENYVVMEDYLLTYDLYDSLYDKYHQASDLYWDIYYLKRGRENLEAFRPDDWGEERWRESLGGCIQRVMDNCLNILEYGREEYYLYSELPEELFPIYEEYCAEAVTTLSGSLLFSAEEIGQIEKLSSYSEEVKAYIQISRERLGEQNGWK